MTTIGDMLKHGYKYVFPFGKHKNEYVEDVLEEDPGYIIWAADNVDWFNPTDEILIEAFDLAQDLKDKYKPY